MADIKRALQDLIDAHNEKHGLRNKVVSERTREERARVLHLSFRELRAAGYKIENPSNFTERHVQALLSQWAEKKLKAATMQSRLSVLRVFVRWIGKPGLIRSPEHYLPKDLVQRSYIAETDKSWTAKAIDVDAKIVEIEAEDPHVGMQLRMIRAFGLRRKEAVMIKPNRADRGTYLAVSDGTKGGRDRVVAINSQQKRGTLDAAKALAKTTEGRISDSALTLPQALDRYSNVVRKFGISKKTLGVTGHGLRAQFACDRYEEETGVPAPVRGGWKVDPEVDKLARCKVTEDLGHSRGSATNAYYGK